MQQQQQPSPPLSPAVTTMRVPIVEPVSPSEQKMRAEFLKKQKELIDLQKKKLKLEMMQQHYNKQMEKLPKKNIHINAELVNNY